MFDTEKETAVWLLNLSNDMRRYHDDKLLDDLPVSIPRDSHHCIIANAFNYGCNVDPDTAEITFQTEMDARTYCKVMGIVILEKGDYELDDDGYPTGDERQYDIFAYAFELENGVAPMSNDLVTIANEFDEGLVFKTYADPDEVLSPKL